MKALFAICCVGTVMGGCAFEGRSQGRPIDLAAGLSVSRPGPGEAVTMEVTYDDGSTELITVAVDDDDIPQITHHEGLHLPPGTSGACASKCDDDSYSLLGFRWQDKLEWSYADAGRPMEPKADVIVALRHGIRGVTKSRNACEFEDDVSASQAYLGETDAPPNVGEEGCEAPDGMNVMGWGTLPSGVLGIACTWSIGGEAVESDIEFSVAHDWYAGNGKPQDCWNRFSLRAVATHEAGHAYGLGHSGCAQTMAPSVSPCTAATRKLGLGDVAGLLELYGPSN